MNDYDKVTALVLAVVASMYFGVWLTSFNAGMFLAWLLMFVFKCLHIILGDKL